eukprot:6185978-Pleurochrysis_carterae.AAC.2
MYRRSQPAPEIAAGAETPPGSEEKRVAMEQKDVRACALGRGTAARLWNTGRGHRAYAVRRHRFGEKAGGAVSVRVIRERC